MAKVEERKSVSKRLNFDAVGVITEMVLTRKPCLQKIWKNGEFTGKTVDAERIYGRMSIEVNGVSHTIDFGACSKSMDGSSEAPRDWKSISTLWEHTPKTKKTLVKIKMNSDYTQEVSRTEEDVITAPDAVSPRIKVSGSVEMNDYYSVKKNEVASNLRYNANFVSTTAAANAEDEFTVHGYVYIRGIKRDEEDHLRVGLYGFNHKGNKMFPIVIGGKDYVEVDHEVEDEFTDYYEQGQSVDLTMELRGEFVGATVKKKTFGKHKMSGGYIKNKMVIVGGEAEPYENEDAMTKADIKKLKQEREAMLAELKPKAKSSPVEEDDEDML